MRLTKFEHSGMLLEQAGEKLFIDPGSFTSPLTETAGTVGVVITHEHADHWTPEQLKRVLDMSPDARVFAPQGVADAASDFDIEVVQPGDTVEVGGFTLRFFGGKHAVIHSSIPVVDNVAVLVNDSLYYAGDSFAVPEGVEVDVLAAPAGGPWMKVAEVMDYVLELQPKRSFTVHEMVLSRAGKDLSNARVQWATEQNGGQFFVLEPGDSLDL